jgi:tetratricopeptide (TPR) repeat protein
LSYTQKALKSNPNSHTAHEILGYIAFSEHRYKHAIDEFNKSLEFSYNRHVVHYNLGLSFEKTGEINKALNAVNTAISLNPLPEYLYKQGELYEVSGMPGKAILSYKRLISIDSQMDHQIDYSSKAVERIRQIRKSEPK